MIGSVRVRQTAYETASLPVSTDPLLSMFSEQRVALADAQGSSDLLGVDDAAKIVCASDDTCCFPISSLLVILSNYDAIICKQVQII